MIKVQHLRSTLENGQEMIYAWFPAMHTRIDIMLYGEDAGRMQETIRRIANEVERLEAMGSYFLASSELAQINRNAGNTPQPASKELREIIGVCRGYHEKTSGCFDISIQSGRHNSDTLASVEIQEETGTVFFAEPETRLNLSGFLKGYALDKVRELLEKDRHTNALINIGNSSVLALGDYPGEKGWKVSFEFLAGDANKSAVTLQNKCLTTSGNDTEGRRHILSPHSGTYVEGARRIAVVTEKGTDGEALSTALFAAAPEQRVAIRRNFQAETIYDFK